MTGYAWIATIAGTLPERCRVVVDVRDQRGDPSSSFSAQLVLSRAHQGQSNSLAASLSVHGEAIHVAAPAVPRSDQYADQGVPGDRNEHAPRHLGNQLPNVFQSVLRRGMLTASLGPECQNGVLLAGAAWAYDEGQRRQEPSLGQTLTLGGSRREGGPVIPAVPAACWLLRTRLAGGYIDGATNGPERSYLQGRFFQWTSAFATSRYSVSATASSP